MSYILQSFENLDISAVFCQCYYSFLCLSCLSESHSTSFILTIKVNCSDAFDVRRQCEDAPNATLKHSQTALGRGMIEDSSSAEI